MIKDVVEYPGNNVIDSVLFKRLIAIGFGALGLILLFCIIGLLYSFSRRKRRRRHYDTTVLRETRSNIDNRMTNQCAANNDQLTNEISEEALGLLPP